MKKFLLPLLVLMFALGFLVRLYRFNGPVADWHSFRQGDTNAVSQIYVRDGIDLLHPRYFDISNVQSGFDNPKGYRMVEFPIYNAFQTVLFETFKTLTLEEWGRIISIAATLGGAFCVYLLTRKYANEAAGLLSAFFYLFLPFSIFYGRTILPDPSMAASILAGIYFFDKWLESKTKNGQLSVVSGQLWLSIFFTAIAFLLKPYALFFTLPMVYLVWNKFGFKLLRQWELYVFAFISLIPLVWWRVWITHFPEGIPVSAWLFNGNGIRFHPAFFRWILYERIAKLIMGFAGIIFLADGLFWTFKKKNGLFFLSFLLSSVAYVCVIAAGNVQHDYYQILIIPTLSIFSGLGVAGLFETLKKYNRNFAFATCSVLIVISLFFGWKYVKDYFDIDNPVMVQAAAAANRILPKDAVIIAPFDDSTTFLNLIQRPGWPVFESDISKLISMGAKYMVLANPTQNDINGFGKTYTVVASSSSYLILKLK